MIFVTVGTHEQAFNRLVKKVDELKRDNIIQDDVFIQTGHSNYIPKYCTWSSMLPYDTMENYLRNANLVISHGGPSTFLSAIQYHKAPIVVPRNAQYAEHVNNHQIRFCRQIADTYRNIIIVEDVEKLGDTIQNYESIAQNLNCRAFSNNAQFCKELDRELEELFA